VRLCRHAWRSLSAGLDAEAERAARRLRATTVHAKGAHHALYVALLRDTRDTSR
jgi:hypothetical protein